MLQDEHNELQSSMFLIKSYEAKLKKESCCPLCSRGFDSESEVSKTSSSKQRDKPTTVIPCNDF